MIILLHNIKDINKKIFEKFKDLELIDTNENEDNIKKFWKDTKYIIDATNKKIFWKKCKENSNEEEKVFWKDIKFIQFHNRKILKLDSLDMLFYKKENFSDEDYKIILNKKEKIINTLERLCSNYSQLEKELEEFGNYINLKGIVSEDDLFLLEDKKLNFDNSINLDDLFLIKELKNILVNIIRG